MTSFFDTSPLPPVLFVGFLISPMQGLLYILNLTSGQLLVLLEYLRPYFPAELSRTGLVLILSVRAWISNAMWQSGSVCLMLCAFMVELEGHCTEANCTVSYYCWVLWSVMFSPTQGAPTITFVLLFPCRELVCHRSMLAEGWVVSWEENVEKYMS